MSAPSAHNFSKEVLDFCIQVPSDGKSLRVPIGRQKTGHPVACQMHVIRPLIHQDR
jgi:hypothetical protein